MPSVKHTLVQMSIAETTMKLIAWLNPCACVCSDVLYSSDAIALANFLDPCLEAVEKHSPNHTRKKENLQKGVTAGLLSGAERSNQKS